MFTVHPRLRGELLRGTVTKFFVFGASPLTRGTPKYVAEFKMSARFIPAYAGNSEAEICFHVYLSVHPRLRGELPYKQKLRLPVGGSSPLTRGTHSDRLRSRIAKRFIPAYAGNSSCSRRKRCSGPVHPRLRGELSDRVDSKKQQVRFIPAYAGNSLQGPKSLYVQTVHPRLRGELFVFPAHPFIPVGSSPLTRGTRFLQTV